MNIWFLSKWTGIPVSKLIESERDKFLNGESHEQKKHSFIEIINKLNKFIYLLAAWNASRTLDDSGNIIYSTKEELYIEKLANGLNKLTSKMYNNTYGKFFMPRLANIGDYLLRKLFGKFDIGCCRHDKKWAMCYKEF